MRAALVVSALLCAGCFADPYVPGPAEPIQSLDSSNVGAVLFLVGDAGDTPRERAPLIHRLRGDVEAWSAALGQDSAVSVLFLGDNVYPEGIRDRGDRNFPDDSARLAAQVWAVSGPQAAARGTNGAFIPGNHDWGNLAGAEGVARLRNQERALQSHRAAGAPVALLPASGSAGPSVRDLPGGIRLVALDTEWWLQSKSTDERQNVMDALGEALATAGDRTVIVVAHHPFITAGPHSGLSTGFDPLWVLRKAGARVQHVNSRPYRALRAGLAEVFERAVAPLIYAAGHDHSLQVLRGQGSSDPVWTLVSGAGSKSSDVARRTELEWASATPGYMRQ